MGTLEKSAGAALICLLLILLPSGTPASHALAATGSAIQVHPPQGSHPQQAPPRASREARAKPGPSPRLEEKPAGGSPLDQLDFESVVTLPDDLIALSRFLDPARVWEEKFLSRAPQPSEMEGRLLSQGVTQVVSQSPGAGQAVALPPGASAPAPTTTQAPPFGTGQEEIERLKQRLQEQAGGAVTGAAPGAPGAPAAPRAPGTGGPTYRAEPAFTVIGGPSPLKLPPLPGQPGALEAITGPAAEKPEYKFNPDGTIDFEQVVDPAPFLTREGQPAYPIEDGFLRVIAKQGMEFDKRREVYILNEATLFYRDVIVGADHIEVDQKRSVATLRDYVFLRQGDDALYATQGYVNYDTGYFELDDVSGNSGSPLVAGRIFFTARRVSGTMERYTLERARVTTCEPGCNQDYTLYAKQVTVKPGSKAVLRNIYLYINQQKVAYLPILIIPLKQHQFRTRRQTESVVEQNYGYLPQDGWFARYAYVYSEQYHPKVTDVLLGVALFGITQKRGNEYGVRQDYYLPTQGAGLVRFLLRQERKPGEVQPGEGAGGGRAFNIHIEKFELGQELSLPLLLFSLKGSLSGVRDRTINPISGTPIANDSITWNLNRTGKRLRFTLTGSWRQNITQRLEGQVRSLSASANASLSYQLTPDLTYNLSQNMSGSKNVQTGTVPFNADGKVSHKLNWQTPLGKLTASLTNDIDYEGDAYSGDASSPINDQRPSVSLTLNQRLIPDWTGVRSVSATFDQLEKGPRNDPKRFSKITIRSNWQVPGRRTITWGSRFNLTPELAFEQKLYSDGNQHFVLRPRINFTYDTRRFVRFNLNWNQTIVNGGASSFDPGGKPSSSNLLRASLDLTDQRHWRLNLSSGFDYRRNTWNPLNILLDFEPTRSRRWGFGINATYDIELGRLRPMGFRLDAAKGRRWKLDLNATLDLRGALVQRTNFVYTRIYSRDLAFTIDAGYNRGRGVKLANVINKIGIRKFGCCSTWDFVYVGNQRLYQLTYTINALPTRSIALQQSPRDDYLIFGPYLNDLFGMGALTRLAQTGGGGGFYATP